MVEQRDIMFWANAFTAAAYYALTIQMLLLIRNSKIISHYAKSTVQLEAKKKDLFLLLIGILFLFCSFISLCGSTHLLHILRNMMPNSSKVELAQTVVMVACACVSVLTVLVGYRVFPMLVAIMSKFELSSEGHLQHSENYLIEVVELINEGVMVLSEDLKFLRGNQAFKVLFGRRAVGKKVTDYLHPKDLVLFNNAVTRVLESFDFTPATIEVRIRRDYNSVAVSPVPPPSPLVSRPTTPMPRKYSNPRVYVTTTSEDSQSQSRRSLATTPTHRTGPDLACMSSSSTDDEYIWIECTMCKGRRLNHNDDFEYDIKMVARNIDDRKKRALYQTIVEGTEERGRINESKMRYISCIAHDLKTPLQSFCFSLDLLKHSQLVPDQREYIEQANVAVDLMKLTISQTMDISKALTGAKLNPRRTTVYISSVIKRVKIIIAGYSKQVPVYFDVAQDVGDAIITDEEWLWQMLLNLLTNACKYTEKGRIEVKLTVRRDIDLDVDRLVHDGETQRVTIPHLMIPTRIEPDMLLCEVIDTGVGINPEKIGRIFDAFSQVQEGQVTGTGLGLFGVRTRAEGLLGTCGARHNTESSTGTGTVLWFAIPYTPDRPYSHNASMNVSPRSPSHHSPSNHTATSNHQLSHSHNSFVEDMFMSELPDTVHSTVLQTRMLASGSTDNTVHEPYVAPSNSGSNDYNDLAHRTEDLIRAHKLTAMVVEDTATVRKLMEKILLNMGFESVTCYENGVKGLEAMLLAPVDIVFSDVQMPIMTGPEMVSRFRRYEAEAIFSGERLNRQLIVAVTANGAECGECGQDGFDEICPKPLQRNEIYQIVNNFLHL